MKKAIASINIDIEFIIYHDHLVNQLQEVETSRYAEYYRYSDVDKFRGYKYIRGISCIRIHFYFVKDITACDNH